MYRSSKQTGSHICCYSMNSDGKSYLLIYFAFLTKVIHGIKKLCKIKNKKIGKVRYRRTAVARTLMVRLPRLFQTRS